MQDPCVGVRVPVDFGEGYQGKSAAQVIYKLNDLRTGPLFSSPALRTRSPEKVSWQNLRTKSL